MYNLAIVCGRFQPFHNGHKFIIDKALEMSIKVGLYIGSANNSGTEWNPLTFEERKAIITSIYPKEVECGRLIIKPLNDRPKELYADNQSWGKFYLDCIHKDFGKPDLFVYGNDKVRTKWFTEKDLKGVDELIVNRDKIIISGTELRNIIIKNDFLGFKKWTYKSLWTQFREIREKILKTQGVK